MPGGPEKIPYFTKNKFSKSNDSKDLKARKGSLHDCIQQKRIKYITPHQAGTAHAFSHMVRPSRTRTGNPAWAKANKQDHQSKLCSEQFINLLFSL